MREFPRPRILLSRCIEVEPCRYNGVKIDSPLIAALRPHVEMIPVCPEMEIGLGVPRDPLRLVASGGEIRLIQPATGRDLTEEMIRFTASFVDALDLLDGIVLKARSPSCGPRGVDIFPSVEAESAASRGRGIFSASLLKRFSDVALAEEGQLGDPAFSDHFLTRLFTLADFRELRLHESGRNLLQFHAENKYILTLYNQKEYHGLTDLVVNRNERSFDAVIREYRTRLYAMLSRRPSAKAHLSVFRRAAEHLIPHAERVEQEAIEETIERFGRGDLPLHEARRRFMNWIEEFDEDYLAHQTYFRPYPDALAAVFT
ncbi:MAG: DUF523 and DUF1722 domain-containing protein [Methanomicrobiales archaeon]|nr:DUF523 and DUF1722 domain-containing protein [Methanomicrobiales archaeon]